MLRLKKTLTAARLRKLYLVNGLTPIEIASRVGCSDEGVRRYLVRHGITRRQGRFPAGKQHPDYIDGRSFLGYQRTGWNPWTTGKTKKTDPKLRRVARKISRTIQARGLGWKPWRTRHDAAVGLRNIATSLRVREARKYRALLGRLGPGWVTEFFIDDFVFRKPDGKWTGVIADLANPSTKQLIEIDGDEHGTKKVARLDLKRDLFLKKLGWTVRRMKG